MRLQSYLNRIGYSGPRQPTREVLYAIHRAHLLAIPYENLYIHQGRSLPLDEGFFFRKLVEEGRGGWCYEMNGLLAWALRELGFQVRLIASAVNRERLGERAEGNHMLLLVQLDRLYMADVGFGNGIIEPLPLEEGRYQQGFLSYGLRREGERWFFQNQPYGGPGFDFTLQPRELGDFAAPCHDLQTAPDSGQRRTACCIRFTRHGITTLRGATLADLTEDGEASHVIAGEAEYAQVLRERFGLATPEAAALWPKVWQAHQEWQAALAQAQP